MLRNKNLQKAKIEKQLLDRLERGTPISGDHLLSFLEIVWAGYLARACPRLPGLAPNWYWGLPDPSSAVWITVGLSYVAIAAWGGTLLGWWNCLPMLTADVALSVWLAARIIWRIGEARVQ